MLKDHENIRFITIPDASNDLVFLKSPKTQSLQPFDHFWSLLPNEDFLRKDLTLSHIT